MRCRIVLGSHIFVYDGGRSHAPKAPPGLTINSITSWVLAGETDCNTLHTGGLSSGAFVVDADAYLKQSDEVKL